MNIIEFNAISKHYGSRPAVIEFSLEIERGERLAILGHSGCGKSTILRLLAGFVTPDKGSIIINQQTVAADGRNFSEPEERNLGMVFQDLALWPHLTVKGNLEFGLKAKGFPKKEREDRIDQILQLVEMEDYSHVRPAELSGGQQQRIALARSLVLQPEILMMDEPLSSVDYELNIQLRKKILTLQKKIGFTLLYVTHNLEEAYDIASKIVVIKNGSVVSIGPVAEIREYFKKL